MNPDQIIQYLNRLPGVSGCFVFSHQNETLASEMPSVFDSEMVHGMGVDGTNAIETLRSDDSSYYELRVDFEIMSILIRYLEGAYLFVLVDKPDEIASIRIASNVASKRYVASDPSTTVPASPETTPISLKPAQETGAVPTKEKPKNSGSIWG
ncbi:MAG: roadblock/LC7 domain-containing protein [Akkermansiaceae bacterium]